MTQTAQAAHVLKDLDDGLVLRRATPADGEAVADLGMDVFGGTPEHRERRRQAVSAMVEGHHPLLAINDFTLVQDTSSDQVVSTLCFISQIWTYGGIEFAVGQVEDVVTHPDYRRRGLVSAQMDVVHRWSAERGEMVTAIDGIPWFYRQFGYEMALESEGGRAGYPQTVPGLKEGMKEPCHIRPAEEHDLEFIKRTCDSANERSLVTRKRDEPFWRFLISSPINHRAVRVIETPKGDPVGVLVHRGRLRGGRFSLHRYDLARGHSWPAVTPSVIRYVNRTGEEYATGDGGQLSRFWFLVGSEHPAFRGMESYLPTVEKPYAWYIRVPDIPGFIRHIAPVLERRLAESAAANHTGELKISFVKDGLRIVIEQGRVVDAEPWGSSDEDTLLEWKNRDALFPDLVFLKMLFGHRSVEELEYAFLDVRVTNEARSLLDILFPKQPSHIPADS